MHRTLLSALILVAAGCAETDSGPTTKAPAKAAPKPAPEPAPAVEPDRVTVSHILIMFAGSMRSTATRTREEAEKLAQEILHGLNKGQDFGFLMRKHSDDPGGGTYTMVNDGVQPGADESPRKGMVPAFGNVGFKLKVGEVGLARYDKKTSPFGYHIIKRVK